MARIALQIAGGVIGGLLAIPTGGVSVAAGFSIGSAIGAVAGSLIFPGGQNVVGPRLEDLNVSSSTDGAPIPEGRGHFRIAGEIIWAQKIQEHKHTEKVSAKGGPTSTTFTYTASFAVAFCKGEADILQLWADSKVIYDLTGTTPVASTDAFRPTLYRGTESQNPDSLIVSFEGADKTPGFRGLCYAVFEDFPLTNFGNRIPNFRATITAGDVADAFPMVQVPWVFPTVGDFPSGVLVDFKNQFAYVPNGDSTVLTKIRLGDNTVLRVNALTNPTETPGYVNGGGDTNTFPLPNALAFLNSRVGVADDQGFLWSSAYVNAAYTVFKMDPSSMQAVKVVIPAVILVNATNALDLNAWIPTDGGPAYIVGLYPTFDGAFGYSLIALRASDGVAQGLYNFRVAEHADASELTWHQHMPVFDASGNSFSIASYEASGALDWFVWRVNMLGANTGLAGNVYTDVNTFRFTGDATTGVGRWAVYDTRGDKLLVFTSTGSLHIIDPSTGAILQTVNSFFDPSSPFNPGACVRATQGQTRDGVFFVGRSSQIVMVSASSLEAQGTYSIPDWIGSDFIGVETSINDLKYLPFDHSFVMTLGVAYPTAGISKILRLYLDRKGTEGFTVGDFVSDLIQRTGVDEALIDVSALGAIDCKGYVITNPQDAKTCIAPLAQFALFDLIESDFHIKAVVRGGASVLTIPEADLGLSEDEQPISETLGQVEDLVRSSTVTYIDPDLDYQQGKQQKIRNSRTTDSQAQLVISSPLIMDKTDAVQMAERYLWLTDSERLKQTFNLWRASYILLDPTDVVNFVYQGLTFQARIVTTNIGKNYAVEIAGVSEDAKKYLAAATGVGKNFTKATVNAFGPTLLWIFDSPLLADSDSRTGQSGFYWAMSSPVGNWPGGVLLQSSDGSDFADLSFANDSIAYGSCSSVLAAPVSPWKWDRVNTLTVFMAKGTPASVTKAQVLNGANGVLVGGEVIQFQTAVQNDDTSWTLSTLLRGRRGTEWACATHAAGENAFFLNLQGGLHRQVQGPSLIGLLRYLKAITVGADANSQGSQTFTLAGNDLKPYAPSHLTGTLTGGDFIITWVRRTRLSGEADWQDSVTDVPLSEDSELYDLEVLDGDTVVHTETGLTDPTFTYTAAMQTTDFGGAQTTISVRVYQKSAIVGRGFAASNTSIGS